MDLQAIVNMMNEAAEAERAKYQLTLGKLVTLLSNTDAALPVVIDRYGLAPVSPHSYRGYYSDIAFEHDADDVSVGDFLNTVKSTIGSVFEGYKGGDFTMKENTHVWISSWGSASSIAAMDVVVIDGKAVIITKEID